MNSKQNKTIKVYYLFKVTKNTKYIFHNTNYLNIINKNNNINKNNYINSNN